LRTPSRDSLVTGVDWDLPKSRRRLLGGPPQASRFLEIREHGSSHALLCSVFRQAHSTVGHGGRAGWLKSPPDRVDRASQEAAISHLAAIRPVGEGDENSVTRLGRRTAQGGWTQKTVCRGFAGTPGPNVRLGG
jgi:hypothetical protein